MPLLRIQAEYFPIYYDYLDRLSLCAEKRKEFEDRLATALDEAEKMHLKWNKAKWQRPLHLFGTLCLEERRQRFALLVLVSFGEEERAAAAIRSANALAGRRGRRRGAAEETAQETLQPLYDDKDAVDEALEGAYIQSSPDGMREMLELHGFATRTNGRFSLVPCVLKELLLLVSMPPRETERDPLLSVQHTPFIYRKLAAVLFVGCAHNLPVEAYVSRVANLSKIHAGVRPVCLSAMFMYKVRLEHEKAQRRVAGMRTLSKARTAIPAAPSKRRGAAKSSCACLCCRRSNGRTRCRLSATITSRAAMIASGAR